MQARLLKPVLAGSLLGLIGLVVLLRLAHADTPGTTGSSGQAIRYIAPDGSDSNPCTVSSPCQSFERVYAQLQATGGTVLVRSGHYPENVASLRGEGSSSPAASSAPVTFKCGSYAKVTFAAPEFTFGPGSSNITVQGGCFHFHIVHVGLGGSCYCGGEGSPSDIVSNVILNDIQMDSFDITDAQHLTIENSQIGPIDACFADAAQAEANGAPASAACDPSNPTEAYWASAGGTLGLQDEPFVHSNGDLCCVTLDHDEFVGMQSKYPSVFHQGGLLIWDTRDLTIENSSFLDNVVYDVEFNAGATESDLTLQNNLFGPPWDSLADANPPNPLPTRQCQEGLYDPSGKAVFTNVLIRYNTFASCFDIGPVSGAPDTYSNVRFVGNLIGSDSNCVTAPGITYGYNVAGHGDSCHGGRSIPGSPFTRYATGDLSIRRRAAVNNYVPCSDGDGALSTDMNGNPRPYPGNTRCSAGAVEG